MRSPDGTSIFDNGFNHRFVTISFDGHWAIIEIALQEPLDLVSSIIVTCLICSDHESFESITTPRYLACVTSCTALSCKVY